MYNNKKDIDLPPGWTTEKKTRMDGKTKGQTDTYYISPSGGRYRSRKECERVLSNLEPPKKRRKKRIKHMPPPPQRPPNIVVQDISNGRETLPIRCVNEVDNETPPRFKYIPKPVPRSQKVALALSNCPHIQCACMAGDCTNSYTCACAFDKTSHAHSTKGTLIYYDLHVIRECSELCPCHRQRCPNRVVNNGIHVRLEVFKTIKCGWGVRTLQNIPAHTFIAEYSGEILSHDEAESRKDVAGGDSYFLDTETLDELRQGSSSNIEYVLDAKLFGNVSRFFNGSCSPNMIKEKGRLLVVLLQVWCLGVCCVFVVYSLLFFFPSWLQCKSHSHRS
jgi:hypothetical protein